MQGDFTVAELELFVHHPLGITESEAGRMQAKIRIIDGRRGRGDYDGKEPWAHLFDVFDVIASVTVKPDTAPEFIESIIPVLVDEFRIVNNWLPAWRATDCRNALRPTIQEWLGKLALMSAQQVGSERKGTGKMEPVPDSPRALWDFYLASFKEKIMVLDICWAARQRYREWMRWIHGQLKPGCKPDRAFRAVLTSGKRPQEYRSEPRPKGWK